jgi:hypothetical protein
MNVKVEIDYPFFQCDNIELLVSRSPSFKNFLVIFLFLIYYANSIRVDEIFNLVMIKLFSSTEIFRELEGLKNFKAIECFAMIEVS